MTFELRPFQIGALRIGSPVVLAALAGYSDLAYRLICRELGSPYCTTEAMLDRQMLVEGRLRQRLVRLAPEDHPVAGQIMGSEPAVMAQAAAVLRDMGFDVIDLNFACPVRKVLGRKRGGYMMGQPEHVIRIMQAVVKAVPDRPVTIKLRRAFHEADMTYEAFFQIAHAAFDMGIAAVCVHARSVSQKYMGQADWGFLRQVKETFPDRTIVGSGDIHTAADAVRMLQETGVDAVTAARGAIGNPWIFRQAQDIAAGRVPYQPSVQELRDVLLRHFQMAVDLYGHRRGPKIMRKFGIKYARMHPTPGKVRNAFIGIKSQKDWDAAVEAMM